MKRNIFLSFCSICILLFAFSCKKNYNNALLNTNVSDNSYAYLKIADISPNFAKIVSGADSFNILVNGQKISGYNITYNKLYPNAVDPSPNYYTTTYAAVPVGNNTIQLAAGINNPDSVVYVTLQENMAGGQHYSLLITDSILNGSKDSSKMFIRDDYTDNSVIPVNLNLNNYTVIRFGHLVLNDTGKIDLWSYERNAALYTNIRPDSISQYSPIGFNVGATDTFYVLRSLPTGTNSLPFAQRTVLSKIAFNSAVTGLNISPLGRAFTILYKGDFTQKTGTKAPAVLTYIH